MSTTAPPSRLTPEPRFPVVAFSIPELDKAIERLQLHGVDLPRGMETNTGGRRVKFQGSPGNLVEMEEFRL